MRRQLGDFVDRSGRFQCFFRTILHRRATRRMAFDLLQTPGPAGSDPFALVAGRDNTEAWVHELEPTR